MSHLKAIIASMRPYQWSKNILLFAGLFFSLSLFNFPLVLKAFYGFLSFIMVSSSVYLFNDLLDIEKDKLHPVKKKRPIPAGLVSKKEAIHLSIWLSIASLFIAVYFINNLFAYIIASYLIINIGYSCCLKNIVILDVFIVSMGFLLRTSAGIIAVDVPFSEWVIIATFLLALLLSIGKRRGEIVNLQEKAVHHRKSLVNYSIGYVDNILNIVAASTIVTYALYTLADETVDRFQTHMLILTTPIVIYLLFRYLYLLQLRNQGEDPIKMILKDKHLVIGGIFWVLMVAVIIYLKLFLQFSFQSI
jgi:4-hydroxybenzoate polyprenyltransferase